MIARSALGLLFALLLAVRLLAPAGFMPAFDRGAVSIVSCPDYDSGSGAMAAHHHDGHSHKLQSHCPYAAASGLGSVVPDLPAIVAMLVLAVALVLGRTFLFLERHRAFERPPLRGPPIPA